MLGKLFLFFVVLPILDLYLLIKVAGYIGVLETIALVVVTGVVGGLLARLQGLNTIRRVQIRLAKRELPSDEVADGALILVGGALLVTPGLITDALGFILLIPVTRPFFRRWLQRYLKDRVHVVRHGGGGFPEGPGGGKPPEDEEEDGGSEDFEEFAFDDGEAVDVDWEDR